MLFTVRNNYLTRLNIFLLPLIVASSFLSISCQTQENNVESIVKKCQVYIDKDDLQETSNCLADAINKNPQIADQINIAGKKSVYGKCNYYSYDKQDYEKAIICYEGFSELEPNMAANYFQLARSYLSLYKQNYKLSGIKDKDLLIKAGDRWRKGLEIKQDDPTSYALYGDILKEEGQLGEALKAYKKSVEIDSDNGVLWVKLGIFQQELLQNEDALESFKKAVNIDENDTSALYFLGFQYEKIGKINEAIETYEKLMKLDHSDEDVLPRLENLRKKQANIKNTEIDKN